MPEGLISIVAVCAGFMLVGVLLGLTDRRNFSGRWLVVAALLVFVNDVALTRAYGLIPGFPGSEWNWLGKILALAITVGIASHPAFGWRRSGLTIRQRSGSLRSAAAVSILLVLLFAYVAITSSDEPASIQTIAYQLTLPGLEEEPFYRGILLLALGQAFRGRLQGLGIGWSWGALLSSALFGLTHAFSFDDGSFNFETMSFLLTGGPALILVWLRERTGSLLLPVLLHNFANAIGLFI